jgi:uncharacterized protein
MNPTYILYLHGFRSSPKSAKAHLMAQWVFSYNLQALAHQVTPITWACPQLPASPREAMALIADITATWPADDMVVVGSSLGGYFATALMRLRGCRGGLINPSVHPARDMEKYIAQPHQPHPPEQDHFFNPAFINELKAINPHPVADWLSPMPDGRDRLGALIAKGDEVLDWREMHAAYHNVPGAHIELIEGGDHTVSDFEQYLPHVMHFLGFEDL